MAVPNLRKKVLVIEDDEPTRDLVRFLLGREGEIELEMAFDGGAGLRRLAAGDVDLLILDLMLPEVNGLDLIDQLHRAGGRCPPIIVATGVYVDGRSEQRIRALPDVKDYFRKPVDYDRLMARIRELLGKSPLPEPVPPSKN